ncbi:hypothetical protein R0J91_21475, partial [Micrococcus sp. SIMBA_131]
VADDSAGGFAFTVLSAPLVGAAGYGRFVRADVGLGERDSDLLGSLAHTVVLLVLGYTTVHHRLAAQAAGGNSVTVVEGD